MVKTISKLWVLLVVLVMLTPLGVIVPACFKAGPAWGEWGAGRMKTLVGYVPEGLGKLATIWSAPAADYTIKALNEKGCVGRGVGYLLSGALGVIVIAIVMSVAGRLLSRKDPNDE